MSKRFIGYTLGPEDTPICDYYFYDGWYSMEGYVLATSEKPCGTTYNWYMQGGKLPTVGIADVVVCKNNPPNKCADTKTIQAKNCDGEYVFYLKSLDGCASAYCIESTTATVNVPAAPILSFTPTLFVEVVKPNNTNKLQFYCDIPTTVSTYFYTVEWSLSTGFSLTTVLHVSKPTQFVSQTDFRTKTALTENHLKQKGHWRLGLTISCSVTATDGRNGTQSTARVSAPQFYGIEALNKTTVKVKNSEEVSIYLMLTVPFGCPPSGACYLDLNLFIPDNDKEQCQTPNLAHKSHFMKNSCGVRFVPTDVGKPVKFRVAGIFGQSLQPLGRVYAIEFITHFEKDDHKIFAHYAVDTVRVELETDKRSLNGKRCHSHNDPHMLTFDGVYFDNQHEGTFILYRNKRYNQQVQIMTSTCPNYDILSNSPWCNCGVIVTAGRDVLIVKKCGRDANWEIRFRKCEDGVLFRKVKKYGDTYHVYLPTGTVVQIAVNGGYYEFLNVDIIPSLFDETIADGLCGRMDNNPANDKEGQPGSTFKDHNLSWKVKPDEDMFDQKNYHKLNKWEETEHLCTCSDKGSEITSMATCSTTKSKTCLNSRQTGVPFDDICSIIRNKRDVRVKKDIHEDNHNSLNELNELDEHVDMDTEFSSNNRQEEEINTKHSLAERSINVYTNVTARRECINNMNTTAFGLCSKLPHLNIEPYVDDCVQDALMTNNMEWARSHLEGIKSQCFHQVFVNQPLPPETLAKFTPITNDSDSDNSTSNTTSAPALPTNTFEITPELLTQISDVSCPNECSNAGTCIKGRCSCKQGFIGEDCSVDGSKPPIMNGIPDKGKCDISLRKCKKTSVLGRNFVESATLLCNLTPYKIDTDHTLVPEPSVQQAATLRSLAEVSCPLPVGRQRRSVGPVSYDSYIARGYNVSITNDGSLYSASDTIVIFDSVCVNCSKTGGNVLCKVKAGYCMSGGKCFSSGENSGCKTCKLNAKGGLDWLSGPDCPVPAVPSEDTSNLWIIAAVLVPVLALTAVIIIVIYCKTSQRIKRNKSASMLPNDTLFSNVVQAKGKKESSMELKEH